MEITKNVSSYNIYFRIYQKIFQLYYICIYMYINRCPDEFVYATLSLMWFYIFVLTR